MNKYVLIITLILTLSHSGYCKWAHIPVNELVSKSDIIVTGTLKNVKVVKETEKTKDLGIKSYIYEGDVIIDEYLYNEQEKMDKCILRWQFVPDMYPTLYHHGHEGKKGIWLLHKDNKEDKFYSANYPGQFIKLSRLEEIKEEIRKSIRSNIPDEYRVKDKDIPLDMGKDILWFKDYFMEKFVNKKLANLLGDWFHKFPDKKSTIEISYPEYSKLNSMLFETISLGVRNKVTKIEGSYLKTQRELSKLRVENARLKKKPASEVTDLEEEYNKWNKKYETFLKNGVWSD